MCVDLSNLTTRYFFRRQKEALYVLFLECLQNLGISSEIDVDLVLLVILIKKIKRNDT